MNEALLAIESDLFSSSSCVISESLESDSQNHGLPNSPQLINVNEQRLTFFVSQMGLGSEAKPKNMKVHFTSATVTKGRAPVEVEANSLSERRVKKSRRRLLDKTLELSFSSSGANSPQVGTPSLPVIDSTSGSTSCDGQQVPQASPSSLTPERKSISAPVESPSAPFGLSLSPAPSPIPLPLSSSSPLQYTMFLDLQIQQQTATVSECCSVKEDLSPFHARLNTKKRKSEEHHSSDRNTGKMFRTTLLEMPRTGPERRGVTPRTGPERRGVTPRTGPERRGVTPRTCPEKRGVTPQQKKAGARPVGRSRVVAVAQSKLTFIKPVKTALPRHPMPFASNMFFDERWMEKQERGFTFWFNYVLTPDDFKVNTEVNKDAAVCLAMAAKVNLLEAPTKEDMSFSTYTARRKLNHLRRSACQIFMSEPMVKAIQRLEVEVEAGRLRVRVDRHLWKDIGERKKVLNWLLSYNPLWLRIGLETIYGELIPLQSNSDTLGLATFILQRLLWNPDIAAKFRHSSVSNLFKNGHEEALSRFTLKKLLLLVCFLDKAKESRLIEHNPCLFCQDAEFKTSKDLLLAFSRDFLSGEGILPRHLSYLGLPVSHSQKPLDEFNFAVKNLAVDLRCGVRLVRVMELFLQDWSLSEKLRMPAISRLQKVHNVDIALQALKSKGVDLKDDHGSTIDARDIVDGHREKTLGLLWKILLAFHLEVILNEDELREEICFLKDTFRTKQRLVSLRADQRPEPGPAEETASFKHDSRKMVLLMDWVRAVCDFYKLKVDNFTVAFSDGRVLCYLIHHYHPGLLPAAAVSHSTTQTVECSQRGYLELDLSASDPDTSADSLLNGHTGRESWLLEFDKLLKNEKNNFRTFNTAVAYLGGVPAMINPADMSNTIPNEKVVISYVSFLCSRLLDLRKESRAARVIQSAWRKYRLKQELQLYKERNDAAVKIQQLVRSFMWRRRAERQSRAAVMIQSVWRGYAARNRMRLEREAQLRTVQHEAAKIIQAAFRSYAALRGMRVRAELRRRHQAATVIQSSVRMFLCKKKFLLLQHAAVIIQSRYRALQLCRAQQKKFTELKQSAVKIQAAFRGYRVRQNQRKRHNAATVIQAQFRMYRVHTAYRALKCAAMIIQDRYRAKVLKERQIQTYMAMKCAAVVIQAVYRGHLVRRKVAEMHRAATLIQRKFVTIRERRRFLAVKAAALVCQRWYRAVTLAKTQRLDYLTKLRAVVCLQAAYRGFRVRKQLRIMQTAAVTIQSHFRKFQQRRNYTRLRWASTVLQARYRANKQMRADMHSLSAKRNAAIVLQAAFRAMKTRQKLKQRHQAATVIQRAHRAFCERERYRRLKSSVLAVQRRYRANVAMKKQRTVFEQTLRAVVILQSVYRGQLVRKEVACQHHAATVIQSAFRRHREVVRFQTMRLSAIIIQRHYRSYTQQQRAQLEFRSMKSAAAVLQQHYRAFVTGRKIRNAYLQKKSACLILQAAFRSMRVRAELRRRHQAATVIQSSVRMFLCKKKFLLLQHAAVIIQRRYRALQLCRAQQKKFTELKQSAVKIQAAFRGYRVRQNQRKRHNAATVIQAQFRMYRVHTAYRALKCAAMIIQDRYRAKVLKDREIQTYKAMKCAAVVIQAVYRGHLVRRKVAEMHRAATLIQRKFVTIRERRRFLAVKAAALVCQRWYRAVTLAKTQRLDYLTKLRAVVCLQAAYRGFRVRKQLRIMQTAAVTIQSHFRKFQQRRNYTRLRWASTVLQARYRANKQMRADMHSLSAKRNAAIVLQAAFRAMKTRQKLKQRHQAATVIQRAHRAFCERERYRRLKSSVLAVQRRYRANVAMKKQRTVFEQTLRAVVILQSVYRGQLVRKEVACQHHAATVIQSAFRRHREVVRFQTMRLSAIIIQRHYRSYTQQQRAQLEFRSMKSAAAVLQQHYRAFVTGRKIRNTYLQKKSACLILQAAFRSMRVRAELRRRQQAATVIQSSVRMFLCKKKFLLLQHAAVIIQRRYRALQLCRAQQKKFTELKQSAVKIQAAFRGYRVRQNQRKRHNAATVIQAQFRMYRVHTAYRALKCAAMIIQDRYRAKVLKDRQIQTYMAMKCAAVVIQAVYRGHLVRRKVAEMHRAATLIQRKFVTIRERRRFLAVKAAALVCQRWYRAVTLAKTQRLDYLTKLRAVVCLQAAYRGFRVRKQLRIMQTAAVTIQSNFRKFQQRRNYTRLRWASTVLQARYRANKQMRADMHSLSAKRNAAIVLQAAFRAMKTRQKLKQRHQAATVIQRAHRAFCERERYRRLKSSVLAVQRRYRANVAMKKQRTVFEQTLRAVVILQSVYRGQLVRKEVACQHHAATVIQSAFRRHREVVRFRTMRLSAIIIQRHYRSYTLARQQREKFLELKRSVTVLQAAFRGWHVKTDIRRQNQAALVIQSCWKGSVERRAFQRKIKAVVKLQQMFRTVLLSRVERTSYIRKRNAAITLQKHWRAWITKRQELEAAQAERRLRFTSAVFHHLCAMKIQRALRAHWALKSAKKQVHYVVVIQRWVRSRQQRKRFLEDRGNVVKVQRAVRSWLARRRKAAIVIQQAVRRFLLVRRQKRAQQGIIKAQALWRGHRSRRQSDNPKLVALRHRLRQITATAKEEDKLINKTLLALDHLLHYKYFSYILEALKNLEITTRLSPECCQQLLGSGVTQVIFTLIRNCNRSVASMEVIALSIQVLLNLSKYHKTIDMVYSVENSVDTLVDMLQRYREKAGDKVAEKGSSIFTKTCCVLAILLQDQAHVQEVMKQPKVVDRIRSIYHFYLRKQKLDKERTPIKCKMLASDNATAHRSNPRSRFTPDWIIGRQKQHDVTDPFKGIRLIAEALILV
ncbi:abnormal spindle-like microcephaly-associated protein [Salarias fasciatus]|uniref:abnormal spindle-like microcephaly-associated protein n=1 Tax=Salarias fasciatus TaxID=181472 RepID=UPI001176F3C6|nr:abnormal spindle-like microcephaly-associated protein [Salarias fasciatus]